MTGSGPLRPACMSCKVFSAAPTRNITSGNAIRFSSTSSSNSSSSNINNGSHGGTVYTSTYIIPPPQLPGEYGENVGRKRKQLLHGWQLAELARQRKQAALSIPGKAGGGQGRAMLDLQKGRFYELEPVDRLRDVLSHDLPKDYHWPVERGSWGTWNQEPDWESEMLSKGPPTDKMGTRGRRKTTDKGQQHLKAMDELRLLVAADNLDVNIYDWIHKRFQDLHSKSTAISYSIWLLVDAKKWELVILLAKSVIQDFKLPQRVREAIINRLFIHLIQKKNDIPPPVCDQIIQLIKRPFSNEALLFMLDRITLTKNSMRLFIADHMTLPHIAVSNKAFQMEMEQLDSSEQWRNQPDRYKRPQEYWEARKQVYKTFTGFFDHDRVNTASIRLLLKYACDRDEVKRILHIVLQAHGRDPAILRETQHQFIEALKRFEINQKDVVVNTGGRIQIQCFHSAESLAELVSFEHLLKRKGVELSRASLVSLISASAIYGSPTNFNRLFTKLINAKYSLQPRELRQILREINATLLNGYGADMLTQRHRIVGNSKTWSRHQYALVLLNHLRQFVGENEANLTTYIQALGRCGNPEEIWREWAELRDKGFKMVPNAVRVKDGTLAAFVSALTVAGDSQLAQICVKEIKQLAGGRITPTIIAGLMARHPHCTGATRDILPAVAKEQTKWDLVPKRISEGPCHTEWSEDGLRVFTRVCKEIDRYHYSVQEGRDLAWAELAFYKILKQPQGWQNGCLTQRCGRFRFPIPKPPLLQAVET